VKIRSKKTRIGDFIVILVCVFIILLCVMPMLNLLAQSLSSSDAVINGRVNFLPVINRTIAAADQTGSQREQEEFNWDGDYSLEYGDYSYSHDGDNAQSQENDYSYSYNDDYSYAFDENFSLSYEAYNYTNEEDNAYSYEDDYGYYDDEEYGALSDEDFSELISAREAARNNFKHGITMEQYRYVFMDKSFTWSMWWTAMLTVICTLVSLTMTVLCAYPLTYDKLKGKILINTIIIFTMYFSAGTIPNYILMKDLGLLNNPLVLIIPNCLSVFNMIILRSFFFGIPESLRESAEIDGANPFTVLVRIYLPLSAPVLATLALFYAVGRWNGFTDALLYINSAPQWVPIQLKLWQLIQNVTSIDVTTVEMVAGSIPRASDAIKAAAIMFATIPILVVYPWLQRYFIAGVTIGAVKG